MSARSTRIRFAIVAVVMLAWSAAAAAQSGPAGMMPDPGEAATSQSDILAQVRYDQRLDEQVPGDLLFRDETGRAVQLGSYFGPRPILLALVYYECPMLCSQVLTGLTSALDVMTFNPGQEFEVVVVSFNPKEGPLLASAKKKSYMERYNRPGTESGWHFLTGPPESIAQLTRAVGFNYVWDERTKQFAHAAGAVLLTPHGKVSKYYYGVEFSARDLRLGMVEAAKDQIGTPVDNLLLYCYHYDPLTGKYGFVAMRAVQLGGIVTIVGMLTFWIVMWRRERAPRLSDAHHA
jgi:protein SCO1/2